MICTLCCLSSSAVLGSLRSSTIPKIPQDCAGRFLQVLCTAYMSAALCIPPFVPFAPPAILPSLVVRCPVSLSSKMTSQTASRIFCSARAICRRPSSSQREPSTRRVHVLILARQRYSSAGLPRPITTHYTASGSTPILMEAGPEAFRPKSSNDCSLFPNSSQSLGALWHAPKIHISSASPVSGLWCWLIKDVQSCYRSRGDFSKRRL